jgi:hypothetical protein
MAGGRTPTVTNCALLRRVIASRSLRFVVAGSGDAIWNQCDLDVKK